MSDAVPLPSIGADGSAGGAVKGRSRVAPVIVLVVAVVMAGLFWILIGAKSGDDADTAYTPLLGKPAPAVQTTTLEGKPFELQRRKGSWVVLNFFNSTCVPCVREHPDLVAFADQQSALGTDGAELYSVISTEDRESAAADFFAANGGTWPVLTDPDAEIQVSFGVTKVPETWVIDPDGRIVWRTIQQVTADSLTRELAVLKADYLQVPG
jgi:cytochrome c biogenesis protein CcmG/thiol:disulfide interchange protein DsbE